MTAPPRHLVSPCPPALRHWPQAGSPDPDSAAPAENANTAGQEVLLSRQEGPEDGGNQVVAYKVKCPLTFEAHCLNQADDVQDGTKSKNDSGHGAAK